MSLESHKGEPAAPTPRRRASREATTEAILDAAEHLFATAGPETVSVRDIAARAGVSHALVHRYLGKKTAIYEAVMRRDQGRILRVAEDAPDLRSALRLMLPDVLGPRREYGKLIAHSVLHGLEWDTGAQGSPAVRRLLELAATEPARGGEAPSVGELDHRLPVAAVVAMTLGWITLAPWLVKAAYLEDLDEGQIVDGLVRLGLRMLERERDGEG